jgi:hypothetical protein
VLASDGIRVRRDTRSTSKEESMSEHDYLTTFVVTYADGTREEIEAHRYVYEGKRDGHAKARFFPFPDARGGSIETIDRDEVASIEEKRDERIDEKFVQLGAHGSVTVYACRECGASVAVAELHDSRAFHLDWHDAQVSLARQRSGIPRSSRG